jgi:hypothetical protein
MDQANGWTPVDASASAWKPVAQPDESNSVVDFAKGVLKGALHTVSAADDFATQHLPAFLTTPIGQNPSRENSVNATQYAHDLAKTTNTAQAIGKGVEQAGEFFIPGGAEKGAGELLATKYPSLASVASKLIASGHPELGAIGKIALGSLGAGAVNATQGGSFGMGAAGGAVGGVIGQGLKSLAPTMAEVAMGTRAADRSLGKTPGVAILNETSGISPGSIARQAFDKHAGYTGDLNSEALNSQIPVDLSPARAAVRSFGNTAAKQNNPTNIKEIQALEDQITQRSTGPIAPSVSADEGLGLRRGVDALIDSWNPNNKRALSDSAIAAVRKAMNDELAKSVPDFAALNLKISNLIPVAARAGATDLNAGVAQKVLGRLTAPTGALLPAGLGAEEGYRHGGVSGGIAGAAAGLILPHVLTSPTTLMMGARALNSGGVGAVAKMLTAGTLQNERNEDATPTGSAKWVEQGASKFATAGFSDADIEALRQTEKGKSILMRASGLSPDSAAMESLMKQAK